MKLPRFIFAFILVLLSACRPETGVGREVEIIIASPDGNLKQEQVASTAVVMLASNAYASKVLHRLSREDAKLFAREEDLQKRLAVTVAAEGKRIRIAFTFPDALVADRVAAAYAACLIQNWVGAVNLDFRALPVNRANQSSTAQRP